LTLSATIQGLSLALLELELLGQNVVKFDPTSSYSFFMELAPTLIFGSTQVA